LTKARRLCDRLTYAGRQLLSGRTQEIATRPDFYQISAQSGDMIRVVLIAQDPDGLAAIVLGLSPRISSSRLVTLSRWPGLGNQLVGDQSAHRRIPLLLGLSVAGGGVADDD